jgi:glycosyltransferase involved in cell wall biosynthesis
MRRVLFIGDAACQTGFARVTKGICDRLDDSRRYEPVVRAINYTPGMVDDYAYEVRPVTSDHAVDPLGLEEFQDHLDRVQPDVLFILQDLWNAMYYLTRKPKDLPTVLYFPVDCPGMKWNYALAAGTASEMVAYTRYGAWETAAGVRNALDVMRRSVPKGVTTATKTDWITLPKDDYTLNCRFDRFARFQNPGQWNVIPHAADHGQFQRMSKSEARKQWGIGDDKFVVLNVGTNQFRKRFDLTIRAFARLAQLRPDAILVLHCMGSFVTTKGWDLNHLIEMYGLRNRVALVHKHVPVVTDEQLGTLYQAADVQINTAGGEGWGLPSQEGASLGVPQLVPDWSATREIWGGIPGTLIRVADWRIEPNMSNAAHAVIDPRWLGERLAHLADHRDELAQLGADCEALVGQQYTWSQVGDAFANVLDRAVDEPAPTLMSLDDIDAAREGTVKGELEGRVDLNDPPPPGFLAT